MVLGLGSRSKKHTSISVEFLIHLREIKPWPISRSSSKSAPSPSVILQWERGDKHSGSTKSVAPSPGDGKEGYKLVFNEQFRLPATLYRESESKSSKSRHENGGKFQRKCVVFSLIAVKGQTLARAVLDLADFAMLDSAVTLAIPLTTVRKGLTSSSGSNSQLYLGISPVNKSGPGGDGIDRGLSKQGSGVAALVSLRGDNLPIRMQDAPAKLDDASRESLVAALMSDEEEEEIASFTDDEDGNSPRPLTTRRSDLSADQNSAPHTSHSHSSEMEEGPTSISVEVGEVGSKFTPVISSTPLTPQQAIPVRSAASAAASAYASKKTLTYREESSSRGSSVDLSSEAMSPETEDFHRRSSLGAQSPSLASKAPPLTLFSTSSQLSSKTSPVKNDSGAIGMELLGAQLPSPASKTPSLAPFSPSSQLSLKTSPVKNNSVATIMEPGSAHDMEKLKSPDLLQRDFGNELVTLKKEEGKVSNRWMKAGQTLQTDATLGRFGTKAVEEGPLSKSFKHEKEQHAKEVRDVGDERAAQSQQGKQLSPEAKSSPNDTEALKGGNVKMHAAKKMSSSTKNDVPSFKDVSQSIRTDANARAAQDPVLLEYHKTVKVKGDIESFEASDFNLSPGREHTEDELEINIMHAARMKFAMGSEERNEKLERKAFEENKKKLLAAEAKLAAANSQEKALEKQIRDLEGELVDAAAVEVALYSVVAQHGSSPHKVNSPARRLARLYLHACKNWSQDRRASCAKSCVSGFVLVARACGDDVTKLSFWLSNAVVLREMVSQAFEAAPASSTFAERKAAITENVTHKSVPEANSPMHERMRQSQVSDSGYIGGAGKGNRMVSVADWREANAFVRALEKVERWIFGMIIESVWWQALTPPMQKTANPSVGSTSVEDTLEETKPFEEQKAAEGFLGHESGDNHQGSSSIELWKSALLDVLQRICPVRAGGHECGCLRWLTKMILEQCLARLDVAIFNAILRDPGEWAPTDPIADPIVDQRVLPIPAGRLTFGGGAEIKNCIRTWSTWLAGFTTGYKSFGDDGTITYHEDGDGCQSPNEVAKGPMLFTLLRGMADLLMLPKDMLMDKSVRREVCPTLSIPLIKKILAHFVPDEFSPDPVTPSLMAALTAEITVENRMHGELDASLASPAVVAAPQVQYVPPPSSCVREVIGDATNRPSFGRSSSSLLRKGHTSDDELEELELLSSFMMDLPPSRDGGMNEKTIHRNGLGDDATKPKLEALSVKRFQLLKEVWNSH